MVDKDKGDAAFMLKYLERAELACIFGSVLFVHGGVTVTNYGMHHDKDERCKDAAEWVATLNDFKTREVEAFKNAEPGRKFSYSDRAGHALMDYGVEAK